MTKKTLSILLLFLLFNLNSYAEEKNNIILNPIKGCVYGIILPYFIAYQKDKTSELSTNTILENITKEQYKEYINNNKKLQTTSEKFCTCLIETTNLDPQKNISPQTINAIIQYQGEQCNKYSGLDNTLKSMTLTLDKTQ